MTSTHPEHRAPASADATTADPLDQYGFADGGQPDGLEQLCALACAATGATAAVIELHGPRARTIAGHGTVQGLAPAGETELTTSSGVRLGVLQVFGGETHDATAAGHLEAVGRSVVALCELEAARAQVFDLEEEVARSADAVAQASGQLVHDLNNPLAAVAMCLEIARDQVPDGELLASLLDRASGSADRMKRMVVGLMDYGQKLSPGVTDLAVELPELLSQFSPLLDETVEVRTPLPVVAASPGEVRTVLTALWENAVKFAPDDRALSIDVAAEKVPGGWRINVTDNGRGFGPQEAERIFAPTVRLDKRIPGLGLGLATVRRIVSAAGGRTGAEGSPDAGATVWFELPAAVPEANQPAGQVGAGD